MGFFDILFGSGKTPEPKLDPLFALSTAAVSFETELGWVPAGSAGLVLRPSAGQDFSSSESELKELLALAMKETGSRLSISDDEYRYRWLVFSDPDWDDLVELVHLAGQTLSEKGFGTQLLAAVFSFKQEEGPARGKSLYLIFHYKRGNFYPFIPEAEGGQRRDSAEEMRIYALMERELPWEKDVGYWYPLWGCPV
jgi:hypothetical protein